MNTLLIATRLFLCGILVVAAGTKLLDPRGTRQALADFRVPGHLLTAGTVALPAAELASAALLVFGDTAVIGSALAVALFASFIAGMVAAVRRGEAPNCHCFGQLHSESVGLSTILRNCLLLAAALFTVVSGPGPGLGAWLSSTPGTTVALGLTGCLSAGLAYVSLTLWQENRRLMAPQLAGAEVHPLPVGTPAPNFAAKALSGADLTSDEVLPQKLPSVLVFTSATCAPCMQLLPELGRWRQMLAGRLSLEVIAAGDEQTNRDLAQAHGVQMVLDPDGGVARAFGVTATPSSIQVDADRRISSIPAPGAPAIEAMIRAALQRGIPGSQADLVVHQVSGQ